MRSTLLTFELGKEFEETTPDGRQVKALVTQEGSTLVSLQTAAKEGVKSTRVVREFTEAGVVQTMEILGTDVVCKQVTPSCPLGPCASQHQEPFTLPSGLQACLTSREISSGCGRFRSPVPINLSSCTALF
jgi:hypothetical protein